MVRDPHEVHMRWNGGEPVDGVAFLVEDLVVVARGPHQGVRGVAKALVALEPEPEYDVETDNGDRFVARQSSLESPVPSDTADCIAWIQKWYSSQCDGEWEHQFGLSIETLDNPGWLARINLEGTSLEGVTFPEIEQIEPRRGWLSCKVEEHQFQGAGGPHMLGEILARFVRWARTEGSG